MFKKFFSGGGGGEIPYDVGHCLITGQPHDFDVCEGKKKGDADAAVLVFRGKNTSMFVNNAAGYWKRLRHPYILGAEYTNSIGTDVFVVTENCQPLEIVLGKTCTEKLNSQETALGIYQICTAVKFLHEQQYCHNRIWSSSVFVTSNGDWKLAGFGAVSSTSKAVRESTPGSMAKLEFDHSMPSVLIPPDKIGMGACEIDADAAWAVDSWQLGAFIHRVYNMTSDPEDLTPQSPGKIPRKLVPAWRKLLAKSPLSRLKLDRLLDVGFFKVESELIYAHHGLETLLLMDETERFAYFKRVQGMSDQLRQCVKTLKFLPTLLKNLDLGILGPECMALVLDIGATLPDEKFKEDVLPVLVKLLESTDVRVREFLLRHMGDLVSHMTKDVVSSVVFKNIQAGVVDSSPHIRNLTLRALPKIVAKLNKNVLKQQLPRVLKTCQQDPEPTIRANAAICVGLVAKESARDQIKDFILPFLCRSLHDKVPQTRLAALMALNGVKGSFDIVDYTTIIFHEISPHLAPARTEYIDVATNAVSLLETGLDLLKKNLALLEKQKKKEEEQKADGAPSAAGDARATQERVGEIAVKKERERKSVHEPKESKEREKINVPEQKDSKTLKQVEDEEGGNVSDSDMRSSSEISVGDIDSPSVSPREAQKVGSDIGGRKGGDDSDAESQGALVLDDEDWWDDIDTPASQAPAPPAAGAAAVRSQPKPQRTEKKAPARESRRAAERRAGHSGGGMQLSKPAAGDKKPAAPGVRGAGRKPAFGAVKQNTAGATARGLVLGKPRAAVAGQHWDKPRHDTGSTLMAELSSVALEDRKLKHKSDTDSLSADYNNWGALMGTADTEKEENKKAKDQQEEEEEEEEEDTDAWLLDGLDDVGDSGPASSSASMSHPQPQHAVPAADAGKAGGAAAAAAAQPAPQKSARPTAERRKTATLGGQRRGRRGLGAVRR